MVKNVVPEFSNVALQCIYKAQSLAIDYWHYQAQGESALCGQPHSAPQITVAWPKQKLGLISQRSKDKQY